MIYRDMLMKLSEFVNLLNNEHPVDHSTLAMKLIFLETEILLDLMLISPVPVKHRGMLTLELLSLSKICKFQELSEKFQQVSEKINAQR